MGISNNGNLNAGFINQAARDLYVNDGQRNTEVTITTARQAVSELRDGLTNATLNTSQAVEARVQLDQIDTAMQASAPAKEFVAPRLKRLTQILRDAGCLATAGASLVDPLHTLVAWLGPLGASIL
jgi:arginyl-tRNA--protein-N-Asp/Glu arginylyltransferase